MGELFMKHLSPFHERCACEFKGYAIKILGKEHSTSPIRRNETFGVCGTLGRSVLIGCKTFLEIAKYDWPQKTSSRGYSPVVPLAQCRCLIICIAWRCMWTFPLRKMRKSFFRGETTMKPLRCGIRVLPLLSVQRWKNFTRCTRKSEVVDWPHLLVA